MKSLHPYLNFDGQAEEAFRFYEKVFGGKIEGVYRFRDMGMGDGPEGDRVAHIDLTLADGIGLMASDISPTNSPPLVVSNNFTLMVSPDSAEEAKRLFSALSEGGDVTMELQSTSWAQLYGECKDRFGVSWAFNLGGD